MNIFALDDDPVIAASYHCDQHLHKMILESAQMLSTAAHKFYPNDTSELYKPAYVNHPCTLWVCESPSNMMWLYELANALDYIRITHGCKTHASMSVCFQAILPAPEFYSSSAHTPFATAMPGHISVRNDLTPIQKYRKYYQHKSMQWDLTGRPRMIYARRSCPDFMQGYTQETYSGITFTRNT